jgi:hypothetical protein
MYHPVIHQIASRVVQEAQREVEAAIMKRSEFAMHCTPKHDTHTPFIAEAVAPFGGHVPMPREFLHRLRDQMRMMQQPRVGAGHQGGIPGAMPPQSQVVVHPGGRPEPPQPGHPGAQQGGDIQQMQTQGMHYVAGF